MLTSFKVSSLAHKCVFYRAERIGQGETHGIEILSF